LLVLEGRNLAGAFLNNGVNLALYHYEWHQGSEESGGIPRCRKRAELPGVESWARTASYLVPRNERVWFVRGKIAWLQGECEKAKAFWEKACQLYPADQIAWLWYFFSLNGTEIRISPKKAEGVINYLYSTGDRAKGLERVEEALEWYELAFSIVPERKGATRLASLYTRLGQKDKVIDAWRKVAERVPDADPDHWWAAGWVAELSGDWEQAAFAYGRGAELAEEPYEFLLRQGRAYARLKEWGRAEEVYRKAVGVRPDLFRPYLSVGHMRRNQKDYEGALEWYRQAEALAPNRLEPKYYLGYAHYLLRDYDKARVYFLRALGIDPKHPWSTYFLAQCLYRLGERDEAIGWLRLAIERHPRQPWRWAVQLGDWLLEAGDKDGALESYKQALEWKPGDETILQKIKVITGS